jgi:hypothetical protein
MATSSVASLNHGAADLGIPRESGSPRFGIIIPEMKREIRPLRSPFIAAMAWRPQERPI